MFGLGYLGTEEASPKEVGQRRFPVVCRRRADFIGTFFTWPVNTRSRRLLKAHGFYGELLQGLSYEGVTILSPQEYLAL